MVGIEHVGYFNQPYPDAEYEASGKLVKYLAAKYSVAKDREHVLGHDQVPNGDVMPEDSPPCEASPAVCETGTSYGGADNHRDPGDWQWCTYMSEWVGGVCKCNDDDCEAGVAPVDAGSPATSDGGASGEAPGADVGSSGGCAIGRASRRGAGFAVGAFAVIAMARRRRGRKGARRGDIGRSAG